MSEKKKFTPETLLKMRHISELTSDGHGTFAYRLTNWCTRRKRYHSEVVLVDSDGKKLQFSDDGRSYEQPRLSPDGRKLAVVAKGRLRDALIVFDTGTGWIVQDKESSHIQDICWSQDGLSVAIIAYEEEPLPDDIIIIEETGRKTNADGLTGKRSYMLQTIDIASGEQQLIYRDDQKIDGLIGLRSESSWIIYSREYNGYIKVSAKTAEPLALSQNTPVVGAWTRGALIEAENTLISPTSEFLYGSAQHGAVALINTDGQECEVQRLAGEAPQAAAPAFADGDIIKTRNNYIVSNSCKDIAYVIGAKNGIAGIYEVHMDVSRKLCWRCICEGAGVYTCVSMLTDHSLIAVWSCDNVPPEVICIDIATGDTKTLTAENQWLSEYRLYGSCEVRYHAEEHDFVGWVIMPEADKQAPAPAMLTIHGGPELCYGRGFSPERQILAANGYAVIFGNPRGSAGYGTDYASAEYAYGGSAGRELIALVDAAVAQENINAKRVSVMGGSYGGYLTAWLAAKTDRFHTACALRGIFSYYLTAVLSEAAGQPMPEDPEELLQSMLDMSVIYHADTIHIPMLICHGERDMTCPVECAYQLYAAVKDNTPETPVKLRVFPGCGHSIDPQSAENSRLFYEEILDWQECYKDWDV